MPGFLLINPRSGDDDPNADELLETAGERGIDTRILGDGDDAAELARAAPEGPLGIAGGDGSLGDIAAVAIERDLPFVCVPFGTRNHFARDLGLDPADPIGALDAFGGVERRVDTGRAGALTFLNNVSFGLYAQLVHRREHHRRRREALARARALFIVARRETTPRVTVDGAPVQARVVLVANNAYDLDLFNVGARDTLDAGLLHLYAATGWLPGTWEDRAAERFVVDADGELEAAVDGEPVKLSPPVEFRIAPRALRVLMPDAPRG